MRQTLVERQPGGPVRPRPNRQGPAALAAHRHAGQQVLGRDAVDRTPVEAPVTAAEVRGPRLAEVFLPAVPEGL